MFGIGGGEFIFIIFIALMLFGSDKIPDIARTLGKTVAQVKNATNDIKSEIQKGVQEQGLDKSFVDIKGSINAEIAKARENLVGDAPAQIEKAKADLIGNAPAQIEKAKADLIGDPAEAEKAKADFIGNTLAEIEKAKPDVISETSSQHAKVKTDLDDLTGPIKRGA